MSATKLLRSALPVAALLACVLSPATADATWPGKPGHIAYWSLDGVHTIRPDGTHDRLVFPYVQGNVFAWSPNGREIGYVHGGVRRARPDGTNQRLIKRAWYLNDGSGGPETELSAPAWGPKGDRLVFTETWRPRPPDGTGDGDVNWIRSVRRDGSQFRKLVRGKEAVWSRSGAHIRFISEGNDIVEIKPNGRGRRVLARNPDEHYPGYIHSLDLSPGGNRLVYVIGDLTVHILNVRNRKHTTFRLGVGAGDVVWAPGGKRLAYISRGAPHSGAELRTIRPNGHDVRTLFTFPREFVRDLAWQTR
jgi:hypothetical protein